MTGTPGHEIVVDRLPPLADRASEASAAGAAGAAACPDAPGRDLASELRAHRDWRHTHLGASPDLGGVDLSGEDLRGVDFTAAPLEGANFSNANLTNARFAWAQLAHADFSGATGVLGTQFARADLTGARLPPGVRFASFDAANEIAQSTSKLLLTMLLVCAYSWLTINSTLDARLLTDTGASQLPILNAQIPIVNFYALVPLALVGLAVVTMLQSQRLWATVAAAPVTLPDGTTMADRAGAWLLGPWVVERVLPAAQRGFLIRLQARLAALVGWWIVPATVAWFWGRYLHRHDWPITLTQLAALTVGCAAAAAFLGLASATLPRTPPAPAVDGLRPGRRWAALRLLLPAAVAAVGVPLVFGLTSYAAIRGVHPSEAANGLTEQVGEMQPALTLARSVPALQAGIPQLMSRVGMHPVAQLAEAEVSTRLAAVAAADTGAEAKAVGARLVGADLRFASGERVFLASSDLRRADLLGADLWSADLRGTQLAGASLAGALLFNADLRKARANAVPTADRSRTVAGVVEADTLLCSRASFVAANLRYARLNGGDFRGAAFDAALLQGAAFTRARVTHATFAGADLDGADFRGAIGLTPDQVLAARHVDALFDSTFLAALRVRSPERLAHYDAAAIMAETERERLSGEDEPDTLSPDARDARNRLIRRAYDEGPATTPSSGDLAQWVHAPATPPRPAASPAAQAAGGAVPYGCAEVRGIGRAAPERVAAAAGTPAGTPGR